VTTRGGVTLGLLATSRAWTRSNRSCSTMAGVAISTISEVGFRSPVLAERTLYCQRPT
jgi:hypothetical protein